MTPDIVQEAFRKTNHALAEDSEKIAVVSNLISAFENGKRPLYIFCRATGNKLGMSQEPVFQKRLANYGNDILKMFAEYEGRGNKEPKQPSHQVKASTRVFAVSKDTDSDKKEKDFVIMPTEFDKDGNPTEYTVTVTEDGKVVRKEVLK